MVSDRFKGKVALVTGAASGIGKAISARLHSEGATVIGGDLVPAASVTEYVSVELDVTCEDQWRSVIAMIERDFGRLDILVNNAGHGVRSPLVSLPLESWRRILSVNLDGVFLGMKSAIPLLRRDGGGAIVNVASVMSMIASVDASAYCASKGGVEALTRAAALEMADAGWAVRINSLHPGYVSTPLLDASLANDTARRDALLRSIPEGRLAHVDEIAAAAAFLAADDSSYMSGSRLVVDGALTAR